MFFAYYVCLCVYVCMLLLLLIIAIILIIDDLLKFRLALQKHLI